MEVAIPSDVISAPSSPKRLGAYYFSAPTSPSHLSQFYRDFDDCFVASSTNDSGSATVASGGASPKNTADDFAFNVSEDWDETASMSADELFDGGVIKPFKPPSPPHASSPPKKPASASPLSPVSRTGKFIQGAFSPRQKNKKTAEIDQSYDSRGRQRSVDHSKLSSSRRAARSLSPVTDTQHTWQEEEEEREKEHQPHAVKAYKKWRLRDFFLFRSASEGRAADKDPLKKYTAPYRHSSFRSVDSSGSGSGSSRRPGRVSAHELHYTTNRAVSEDLKKKTFLPYKQGILGRLAFNPAVHALANGFGFSRK